MQNTNPRPRQKQKYEAIAKALDQGDALYIKRRIASDDKARAHCFRSLIRAAEKGNVPAISTLIAAGIDHPTRIYQAFCAAFMKGHLPAVQFLFAKGINDAVFLRFRPAAMAAGDGRPDLLAWALQNGDGLQPGDFSLLFHTQMCASLIRHQNDAGYVACIEILLDHALSWPLTLKKAMKVALKLKKYKPCQVVTVEWLAKLIP